jgi:hypothetical protein
LFVRLKQQYVFNQPLNTNLYLFSAIQLTKMPTKNPSTSTNGSEDGLTQPVKKKVQRGILSITRSQDRPKRNAPRPDKHNAAPLLAKYASAKTSKTAVSLPPISLRDNNTKSKTNQSQGGGGGRTAWDVDSVTMPSNMEGAADTLTDAAGTQIKSAASSATIVEVLPRPAGANTQINLEAGPPTVDGAEVQGATPSDRSTRINAVSSSAIDGGGVDVTRSPKILKQPGRHLMMEPWRCC